MIGMKIWLLLTTLFIACRSEEINFQGLIDVCANSTYCLDFPSKCATSEDTSKCTMILTIEPLEKEYIFTTGAKDGGDRYVILGFSSDKKMGDDVTVDCYKQNDKYSALPGINKGHEHETKEPDEALINLGQVPANADSGPICQFKINQALTVDDHSAKMSEARYYLLLSTGPLKDGKPDKHDGYVVSDTEYEFNYNSSSSVSITTSVIFLALGFLTRYS